MKKAAIIIGQIQKESGESRPLIGVDNDLADMHGFLQRAAGYDVVHLLRDQHKAEVLETAAQRRVTAHAHLVGRLLR